MVFTIDTDGIFNTTDSFTVTKAWVWPEDANRGFYALNAPLRLTPSPWPDAPTTPQTEIVAPYWTTDGMITGNYLDLADFTSVTFASLYGAAIDGADFNAVYAVNGKRALVNTNDSGNRLQIQHTADCHYASLFVCDSDGDVVDVMTYTGVPNGDSVQVPVGANYYVIAASDTGNVKIKKWDSSSTIDITGSVTWQSAFGSEFLARSSFEIRKNIPAGGLSVRFTAPDGIYSMAFGVLETSGKYGTVQISLSDTVGNLSATPNASMTVFSAAVSGGINYAGAQKILVPGNTYFFNIKWADSAAGETIVTFNSTEY